MKICILVVFMVFAFAQSQAQCDKNGKLKTKKTNTNKQMPEKKTDKEKSEENTVFDNLPKNVKLTDEVIEDVLDDEGKVISTEIITVKEKLKKIGAKYEDGKLIDDNGKEIRFYNLPIRGISQGFEEDQKQAKRDAEELKKLKEKYTLIIMRPTPLNVPY